MGQEMEHGTTYNRTRYMDVRNSMQGTYECTCADTRIRCRGKVFENLGWSRGVRSWKGGHLSLLGFFTLNILLSKNVLLFTKKFSLKVKLLPSKTFLQEKWLCFLPVARCIIQINAVPACRYLAFSSCCFFNLFLAVHPEKLCNFVSTMLVV